MDGALVDTAAIAADAVKKISSIATLPEVTTRIIAAVEDPRSSAAQLHRIVSHDPALVTRILKIVNSAFYGLPGQIASIDRAIVMLGLNAVKNIAVAASLGELFRGVKLTDEFTARDLWSHCIAVAVCCRELAREAGLTIADEAFLAGMIHDIGLLVAMHAWPQKLREVCQQAAAGGDFCQIERDTYAVDHQQLGHELTESWKFPRSCQLVTAHHHKPEALPPDQRLLSALVYTADTLCAQRGIGFNLTALHQSLSGIDLAPLPITPAMIDRISLTLNDKIADANALLT
ncbi:MAG: HDOD domain-containing protein [Phycisphaerales bacterium]|nr:HDOD domain-containing protein [Phycisphaerales bacterium]